MVRVFAFPGKLLRACDDIVDRIEDKLGIEWMPVYWSVSGLLERRVAEPIMGIYDFWQRGRRGYADRDVWGLDEYITSWLPSALVQLANGHTYPGIEQGFETPEKWTTFLKEQARIIKNYHEINCFHVEATSEERIESYNEAHQAIKRIAEHFFHLWD